MASFNVAIATENSETAAYFLVRAAQSTKAKDVVRVPLVSPNNYARYVRLSVTSDTQPVSLQLREVRVVSLGCVASPLPMEIDYRNLALVNGRVSASVRDPGSAGPMVTVDGIKFPRQTLCYTTSQVSRFELKFRIVYSIFERL